MKKFPKKISNIAKYQAAIKVTTKQEADQYLEACIEHTIRVTGMLRLDAEKIEKHNIGYWAGYYDEETAKRVWELFDCEHPVFKRVWPTPGEAFKAGVVMGENYRVHRNWEAEP